MNPTEVFGDPAQRPRRLGPAVGLGPCEGLPAGPCARRPEIIRDPSVGEWMFLDDFSHGNMVIVGFDPHMRLS